MKLTGTHLGILVIALYFVFQACPVQANDAFIYYSTSTSSQYANLKSELEDLGFT